MEGLRRWLRRSEERLRKLDRDGGEVGDVGVWLDEMVQDAKILVDDLDNPIHLDYQNGADVDEDVSLTAPISGSLARLVTIQSTIDDLVDELQRERERRIRAEGALINKEAHDVDGTMMLVGHEKRMEGQGDVEGEQEAPPPPPPPKNQDQEPNEDPVFLDDRIPISPTPPSLSLPPPPNTTSPLLKTPVPSADETQPPILEPNSAHISINNNTNDIPVAIAEGTIPAQSGSPVLPSDLTSTSATAHTTEAATPTGATEDTQPLNAHVSETTEGDVSVAKEGAEKVEGGESGSDAVTGPVDAESEVEVVHVPQVQLEAVLTNVDEEREVEKVMGEEPTVHVTEEEVEACSEPSAANTASAELQVPEEEGLGSTTDVVQTIVAAADVQVESQPTITPSPAALLSTDSTIHDRHQVPTPPPDRPVSSPAAPQLTPTPSPPPAAPQLILPPPPPSPPPPHPLLNELQKARSRYDHIQRAFHDCHLALDSLKSSFTSTPPVRDNAHTTIPHEVLKAIIQRLDDYTEDVRVELEIRISDEEVLGRGYEALLSVPGALQATSPSLGPREAVAVGSSDGEGKETLETIEVQIQAFVNGTDPTVQKAVKTFERKLEDLQHDVAVVKRAVYDPQSEILSAPVIGMGSSPVQHPTPDSSGSSDDNGGGGGWTSWIRTPSRPTTPTPAPAPTFGSVMTSRNRTGIRRTVSAFGLSSNNTSTRGGGDIVKALGLKLPMPDFTFALSAPSSVKTKDEEEEQDSMVGLGLGLGLGWGLGAPRSRTVSATYMLGMGVKSGGGGDSVGVVGGGMSPRLMASPLQRRVVSAVPRVGGAASAGVRGLGGARREGEEGEEDVD